MSYTVVWRPSAERDLAQIWNDAPDRDQVTAAADSLDECLRRDPLSLGESRGDVIRIATEAPLTILFDVHVDDRKVIVWDVWRSA
jgi:plasmid stabilization system protein ParE